ncbi:hypothetical protein SKAU_G00145300 [Synaphobranchus kaupii]|uniref:Uncharacterized protein n=1 Tax=Synaphobranchus kaupii TaxID=118154 RepID=A0A9Q1FTG3_SYNKA|nr:hypothetical protein SKAU_G00145300 [Synaphobranchus kaupii]
MKGQTLLAWGMVLLLCVALMSTEENQKRALKCCTRKDIKFLKELHKHKVLRIQRFCKRCRKPRKFFLNPGIPLPSL